MVYVAGCALHVVCGMLHLKMSHVSLCRCHVAAAVARHTLLHVACLSRGISHVARCMFVAATFPRAVVVALHDPRPQDDLLRNDEDRACPSSQANTPQPSHIGLYSRAAIYMYGRKGLCFAVRGGRSAGRGMAGGCTANIHVEADLVNRLQLDATPAIHRREYWRVPSSALPCE